MRHVPRPFAFDHPSMYNQHIDLEPFSQLKFVFLFTSFLNDCFVKIPLSSYWNQTIDFPCANKSACVIKTFYMKAVLPRPKTATLYAVETSLARCSKVPSQHGSQWSRNKQNYFHQFKVSDSLHGSIRLDMEFKRNNNTLDFTPHYNRGLSRCHWFELAGNPSRTPKARAKENIDHTVI